MQCELSGKEFEGPGVKVKIEGVVMTVAPEFAKYGTPVQEAPKSMARSSSARQPKAAKPLFGKEIEFIDVNYGALIKRKREAMGMRQKDLARFLNERESLIHQLESGHIKPSERVLNKLEGKLGLKLLKVAKTADDDDADDTPSTSRGGGFTIGDMLKKK